MHHEFLQNIRPAGQSRWHVKLQDRKLSVTSFLLDKGSSSLGGVSQLEWKECEMEPQVTVISQGHICFGS